MAYYGDLLDELGQYVIYLFHPTLYPLRKHESDISRQHTRALEQQLQRLEEGAHHQHERRTVDKKSTPVAASEKKNHHHHSKHDNDDNESITSFKTANTGFTGTTIKDGPAKILKENIIFQKYVEVNEVKFKIVMVHLKELQAVQIIVYNKPRNLLQKVFVHFQDISDYAKKHGINMSNDIDANKILTK